jgi:hypothetical protein
MTFNEGIQIDTSTTSGSGSGGRRGAQVGGDQQAGSAAASVRDDQARPQKWFTVGYHAGEPKQCDTYSAPDLG